MKWVIVNLSLLGFLAGAPLGCDRDESQGTAGMPPARTSVEGAGAGGTTQRAGAVRVVFLGDSLTAGLGVEAREAFPMLVGEALEGEGLAVQVVNGGVSGDTT